MYNKKEFYKISINDAVKTINKCVKLTKSKKISEDTQGIISLDIIPGAHQK